jgi:group II intron reverse transcriptase/maturase
MAKGGSKYISKQTNEREEKPQLKPTFETLKRIHKSSTTHKHGVFTRLYRYLLREDIYYASYQKLYANKGAATKGVDTDTADGFSEKYVKTLIAELKDGSYCAKPVRRQYILKENGKMRPLGIPSFRDKLLQEVIRQILEAIYEPIFSDNSHGFRPKRSCHTCLKRLKKEFTGAIWFIEGDIKGCFDNIDHEVLLEVLQRKIKDSKLINLIRQFLKAGYVEDWKYNPTYSGTPQGGILSPILANIYLNELDKKVADIKEKFHKPKSAIKTKAYYEKEKEIKRFSSKILREKDDFQRKKLLATLKKCKQELRKIPYTPQDNKRLVYVRYADDWLIGICGDKEDCEEIKKHIGAYLRDTLKLELSEEKTFITHSSKRIRFLGYDISVRRSQKVKGLKNGSKVRTLNHRVELLVPLQEKIEKILFTRDVVVQTADGELKPIHRPHLLSHSDREIVEHYNAEIRGICNYYCLAVNYYKLNYFCYLMEYSCLKTLANKHKTTISKIVSKYRHGKTWSIPYMTKSGPKRVHIVKTADCKQGPVNDTIPRNFLFPKRRTIQERLNAHICELCGVKKAETYEIHHVGSLKKLGDSIWETVMKRKRRKTLVVCDNCHTNVIHG